MSVTAHEVAGIHRLTVADYRRMGEIARGQGLDRCIFAVPSGFGLWREGGLAVRPMACGEPANRGVR
jgi:hypothetical protein